MTPITTAGAPTAPDQPRTQSQFEALLLELLTRTARASTLDGKVTIAEAQVAAIMVAMKKQNLIVCQVVDLVDKAVVAEMPVGEAWRCPKPGHAYNLCPPEGCPKDYCARDEGWLLGQPSPDKCTGRVPAA
jgi:hypothetical protein